MADRYNISSQVEHLQAKYVGTGHADISKLYVSHFIACVLTDSLCF
jgi:hypothetical protein